MNFRSLKMLEMGTSEHRACLAQHLRQSGMPTGDSGDRFRTAADAIGFKGFEIGLNMFTGDPGLSHEKRYATIYDGPSEDPNGTYGGEADKYRAGLLSIRIGNYRFGTDSENVRAFVQNKMIHNPMGVAHFRKMDNKWNPYFQYASINPFTLW